MLDDGTGLWLVRLLVQRGLAAIYLVAFVSAVNQAPALLGKNGLLPIALYVRRVSFEEAPSLFHLRSSDRVLKLAAWLGVVLSLVALTGLSERGPIALSMATWLALWALYLSFVNVGQRFYAFGWESMLLEAGFLGAFLGPSWVAPSYVPILALRWMLFRTELGAGLIKLRHDACWRDLTCLFWHHETQPLPNALSRSFHRLPRRAHKLSVVFSHFVQLVCPFALFLPQPLASIAGAFIVVHQLLLIVSGNYSWLNWLTVVLGVTAFSGRAIDLVVPLDLAGVIPAVAPRPFAFDAALHGLGGIVLMLSVRPVLNLFKKHQLMNFSYNPVHLVNTYGAFGSVTKVRHEIVVEGADDERAGDDAWRAYEFKAKPGDVMRRPRLVAPYHLRLDWLMWFLPFSVTVTPRGVYVPGYDAWFIAFVERLLDGDAATMKLLGRNPFPDAPPRFVRARMYRYRYTTPAEKKATGAWWHRDLVGEYLPAVSASTFRRLRAPDVAHVPHGGADLLDDVDAEEILS